MRYRPSTSVLVEYLTPVAVFDTVTVALGTNAPVGSRTEPVKFPSIVWARLKGVGSITESSSVTITTGFMGCDVNTIVADVQTCRNSRTEVILHAGVRRNQ